MLFLENLGAVPSALRSLAAALCRFIYWLIANLFELFINISKVDFLGSDNILPIYQRITLILAIVMVFYVTLEFVKYVVEPDGITDKEKGVENIVQKMIIVVVLIAFVPNIFSYAYKLQNTIIEQQIISKVILGTSETDTTNFGRSFAADTLHLFYGLNENVANDDKSNKCGDFLCNDIVISNIESLRTNGDLSNLGYGLEYAKESEPENGVTSLQPLIRFDGLFAVLVGGFIAYILILYCIDIGTRVFQLAFLQIIAPIPIIGYLSPKKDNIFTKWWKQCLATYIDLFMRLAIIYFVLFICQIFSNAHEKGTLFNNIGNDSSQTLLYIALIMGLLLFAQRAPKMLQELFPKMGAASGEFGFSPKGRGFGIFGRVAAAGAGTAIGAGVGLGTGLAQGIRRRNAAKARGASVRGQIAAGIGGGIMGATRGAIGGAGRGLWNGGKKGNVFKNSIAGAKNQVKANKQFGNRQENGYGLGDQLEDRARSAFGFASRVEVLEGKKAPLKRKQDQFSEFGKSNDAIREHAFKKAKDKGLASYAAYATAEGRLKRLQEDKDLIASLGGETSAAYQAELQRAGQEMKKYKDEATNEYIDSEMAKAEADRDGKLNDLVKDRDQKLKDYNDNAAKTQQISDTATIKLNGITITKRISDMTAEEYDAYVKQVANVEANRIGRDIGSMTAEQEAIKREIEGSGIGGDKK